MQILVAATVCLIVGVSNAAHSEFVSIGEARDKLADEEFSFSFKKDGAIGGGKGIRLEQLNAKNHRLLGMPDVDVSINRVFQDYKHVIPWHVHPRGSEHYATITGYLQVTITLEGMRKPRRVVSKLPPGHVAAIPQGIPHTVTCLSRTPCEYHVFFNKADGGFAFFAPGIRSGKNQVAY